jgi:hypothetical protein
MTGYAHLSGFERIGDEVLWVSDAVAEAALVVVGDRCRTWLVRNRGGYCCVEAAASVDIGSLEHRVLSLLVLTVGSHSVEVEASNIGGSCQAQLHGSTMSASDWVATLRVDLHGHFCSAALLASGWVASPELAVVGVEHRERHVASDEHPRDASLIQGCLDRFQLLYLRQKMHNAEIQFLWVAQLSLRIEFARN